MISRLSPAKVNLHLSVLRRRPDGYHDIKTLLQCINLFDELAFRPIPEGITIRCDEGKIPANEDNIVYRAAQRLFRYTGYTGGVSVEIVKNIPVAAGLGGGSSNAATTLMALNELFAFHLSRDELMKIGAAVGADVPFFIFAKRAWAEGIGDILTEASDVPFFWFVLVNPGFPVSTGEIYRGLNLPLTKDDISYTMRRPPEQDGFLSLLKNDLESVTIKLHPVLLEIKDKLKAEGARAALMSGSGPTVFGLFDEEGTAQKAAAAIRGMGCSGWEVFVARSL